MVLPVPQAPPSRGAPALGALPLCPVGTEQSAELSGGRTQPAGADGSRMSTQRPLGTPPEMGASCVNS